MTGPEPPTRNPDDPLVRALLGAYAQGIFPMAEPDGAVYWIDPDERGVITLEDGGLRVPRSLRQRVRSGRFAVTTDRAFGEVIRACAEPRPGQPEGTWIDERIVGAYERLHQAGYAHSVEAWLDTGGSDGPRLVGGLYGVQLRGLFAGESMFSRPELGGTDASKVCLVHLWRHLRARGFTLLDTQFITPHLARLGAVAIPREAYHARLAEALGRDTAWLPFKPN